MIFCAGQVQAESVFVQDLIFVPLRGGASDEHRIIHRGIKSGTSLERLEIDPDSGFSKVRLQNGTEGWIKSQYISAEPIAKDKLAIELAKIAVLESEKRELDSLIDSFEASIARLQAENNALTLQTKEIQTDLDEITRLSENTLKINDENIRLESRNLLLMEELDTLTQMNVQLADTRNQRWFLLGAVTLLVGMIPGFWFARLIYNRRSTGWAE
jgi:SH3 domain protein